MRERESGGHDLFHVHVGFVDMHHVPSFDDAPHLLSPAYGFLVSPLVCCNTCNCTRRDEVLIACVVYTSARLCMLSHVPSTSVLNEHKQQQVQ
jgi:hypothetical protein